MGTQILKNKFKRKNPFSIINLPKLKNYFNDNYWKFCTILMLDRSGWEKKIQQRRCASFVDLAGECV